MASKEVPGGRQLRGGSIQGEGGVILQRLQAYQLLRTLDHILSSPQGRIGSSSPSRTALSPDAAPPPIK
eukprot:745105-Prorocentrum_lima.AAC.1